MPSWDNRITRDECRGAVCEQHPQTVSAAPRSIHERLLTLITDDSRPNSRWDGCDSLAWKYGPIDNAFLLTPARNNAITVASTVLYVWRKNGYHYATPILIFCFVIRPQYWLQLIEESGGNQHATVFTRCLNLCGVFLKKLYIRLSENKRRETLDSQPSRSNCQVYPGTSFLTYGL